jgi:demethylmenaquinone methyltransferase/2-methoxy-6-polyprenyl-1,4-benzoquinol methylase
MHSHILDGQALELGQPGILAVSRGIVMTEQSEKTPQRIVESPIPAMPDYFRNDEEKTRFLLRIFDDTAADYDRMERILGMGAGSRYRREALERAGLMPQMSVIDVAVGTGLVAREAVRIVGKPGLVVGMDPSAGMLSSAKLPPGVRLVEGRAEVIPFHDGTFDFLSMGYALRHMTDLSIAFREFHRVLKPGGRICILEITPPQSRIGKACLKTYLRGIVPMVGRLFAASRETATLWRYHWDTIEACAPADDIVATLRASGFESVRREVSHFVFSEYQAVKHS